MILSPVIANDVNDSFCHWGWTCPHWLEKQIINWIYYTWLHALECWKHINFQKFGPIFVQSWIRPSRFEQLLSTHPSQAFPKNSQNFVRTVLRHIRIFVKFLSAQGSGIWRELPRSCYRVRQNFCPDQGLWLFRKFRWFCPDWHPAVFKISSKSVRIVTRPPLTITRGPVPIRVSTCPETSRITP